MKRKLSMVLLATILITTSVFAEDIENVTSETTYGDIKEVVYTPVFLTSFEMTPVFYGNTPGGQIKIGTTPVGSKPGYNPSEVEFLVVFSDGETHRWVTTPDLSMPVTITLPDDPNMEFTVYAKSANPKVKGNYYIQSNYVGSGDFQMRYPDADDKVVYSSVNLYPGIWTPVIYSNQIGGTLTFGSSYSSTGYVDLLVLDDKGNEISTVYSVSPNDIGDVVTLPDDLETSYSIYARPSDPNSYVSLKLATHITGTDGYQYWNPEYNEHRESVDLTTSEWTKVASDVSISDTTMVHNLYNNAGFIDIQVKVANSDIIVQEDTIELIDSVDLEVEDETLKYDVYLRASDVDGTYDIIYQE